MDSPSKDSSDKRKAPFDLQNTKLLIVDDEPELLATLQELLKFVSPNIVTASDGLQALQVLAEHSDISAVLSDIAMPTMTGIEFLSAVRAQFNPIPFVVLTGHGDAAAYREAVRLNATDFLEKPFNSDQLIEVMTKAVHYGIEVLNIERELEEFALTPGLAPERVSLLKRLKRTTLTMRAGRSIYLKKSA